MTYQRRCQFRHGHSIEIRADKRLYPGRSQGMVPL